MGSPKLNRIEQIIIVSNLIYQTVLCLNSINIIRSIKLSEVTIIHNHPFHLHHLGPLVSLYLLAMTALELGHCLYQISKQ